MASSHALAEMLRERTQSDSPPSMVEEFFEIEPVPLDTFVTDAAHLNNPPLSEIQYDVVRHLEQVYLPETYPAMVEAFGDAWEPVRFINFAWIQWGKGSGKDHICRVANARAVYLLSCLKSPQDYFGMPGQDWIHTLNVAASATQASRAYFKPFKELILRSRCFADTAEPVEYSIRFDKQLEAVSGHSLAETMEGLNLLFGIADEISAFKTKAEVEQTMRTTGGREPTKTAESIIKMMRTSARTRFPKNFKLAAISYPRFKGDAIQTLCARGDADMAARGERSRTMVSGPHATWEVNPRISGREDFVEDYDEDPVMARTMYECLPEAASNRFFSNDHAVHAAFSAQLHQEPVAIEYVWGRDKHIESTAPSGADVQEGWQAAFILDPNLRPIPGALYALHGDMAITGDRAGVAMAHVKAWKPADTTRAEEVDDLPTVKLDFVTSFQADLGAQPKRREVQIRWYRQLISLLIERGFPIVSATFDRFESADTMQTLTLWGVESKRVSIDVSASAYSAVRDLMYEYRLEGYYRQHVIDEFLTLSRLPNGKVDHPPGGSKDEADAVAGAVLGALAAGGEEAEDGGEAMTDMTVGGGMLPPMDDFDPFGEMSGWGARPEAEEADWFAR